MAQRWVNMKIKSADHGVAFTRIHTSNQHTHRGSCQTIPTPEPLVIVFEFFETETLRKAVVLGTSEVASSICICKKGKPTQIPVESSMNVRVRDVEYDTVYANRPNV
ncbi:protein O-linked-mannose beta-1,2-N-acetylglucosaminyltransferase 1 [Anopheles sinensis]|uniref:Protein O-linked-mannose beta-1,2-N-acetylglucosaminyltransferase 1 n=1 Tax=Anopheles sinensis TaxID=74873 RepID=A0A084WG65_ANOSI|nr:protein O-linked-mannose beta-1,2-N-acetylglucosaminyltransferase 1 [Anopheles sinensis]